jgi:tripartite-type tricarboxylate transporter receptor subunit TctC
MSLVALASGAAAQGYPAKPIRVVLPVAPGGGSDIIVRIVTQKVTAAIGQQFVIDYRGGANGNIAHDLVAKAPPTATRCCGSTRASPRM